MAMFADVTPVLGILFGGGAPGFWEIMLILMAMLLLFGKRLPEVGRSLGRGFVEFKKGLKGVQDEIHQIDVEASRSADAPRPAAPAAPAAPKELPDKPAATPAATAATEEQKTA
ncbi:MAG: twin-arginine translocase TatA/TatE family subunit [Planctomycetota bacterium]